MIISASYKTDIPAFYGAWFLNRLRAEYCKMLNPYNRRAIRVSLSRNAVDGFVFWTKNLAPFFPALEEVRKRDYPFMVQYSINGYPRALEFSVTDAGRSVSHMAWLRDNFGPMAAVWRYDPVIFTSVTDPEFHIRNFSRLADKLFGLTNEVVVSFAQIYRKTERNMNWASKEFGFAWEDPKDEVKIQLAREFGAIAKQRGMQLNMCSQPQFAVGGIGEAQCVSGARLSLLAGRQVKVSQKGNRPDCACSASRDIGDYDTCPHGCVYCYAVQNREVARQRYQVHDPEGEYLFEPEPGTTEAQNSGDPFQIALFDDESTG
jgi:hypothetical protein